MIQQTPSLTFKTMAFYNLDVLTPWSCESKMQLKSRVWPTQFGVDQSHQVHIRTHHDITNHHETWTYYDHLKKFELDFNSS
jgi:hypothetical protein